MPCRAVRLLVGSASALLDADLDLPAPDATRLAVLEKDTPEIRDELRRAGSAFS